MSPRRSPRRAQAGGFTLIELLIVIAIVAVLAGLILGVSGYAQKKAKRSRAEVEIGAMSAALENYKSDNGIFPTDSSKTETLDPASATETTMRASSKFLYGELTGDRDFDGVTDVGAKSYMAFKPQMFGGTRNSNNVVTKIEYLRDPFGNSYGYSTLKAANPTATGGFNPTFDLWSNADTTGSTAADQVQWIKNW